MVSSILNREEFQKFFQDSPDDCLEMYLQPSQIMVRLISFNYRYGFSVAIGARVMFTQPVVFYYQQDAADRLKQFLFSLINFINGQIETNQTIAQLVSGQEGVLNNEWIKIILREFNGVDFIDRNAESVWSLDSRYMAIM